MFCAPAGFISLWEIFEEEIKENSKEWRNARELETILPSGSGLLQDPLTNFKTMIMANKMRDSYGIGVGVAGDGLLGAYFFELFGLPMKLARCRRKGQGASFEWIDETNEGDFKGKDVLVVDLDFYMGRTAKRVARELKEYSPRNLDLALTSAIGAINKSKYPSVYQELRGIYRNIIFACEEECTIGSMANTIERLESVLAKD